MQVKAGLCRRFGFWRNGVGKISFKLNTKKGLVWQKFKLDEYDNL
jgi:hypothetical protein